jgi:LysM repeat protein
MLPKPRRLWLALAMLVAGCSADRPRVASELGDYHPSGTGPFDSEGNYVESWADKPSRWRGRSVPKPPSSLAQREVQKPSQPARSARPSEPERRASSPPVVVSNTPSAAPKPKPKPKPTPVKVTPKKPAPVRVTVKKGDTLYGISRRYKTSVAAIKRANGLKSDLIRPGQKLVVPR